MVKCVLDMLVLRSLLCTYVAVILQACWESGVSVTLVHCIYVKACVQSMLNSCCSRAISSSTVEQKLKLVEAIDVTHSLH